MKTFVNPKYERREGEDAYEYGLRLIEIKVEQRPDDLTGKTSLKQLASNAIGTV